jgi:flagellar basal-body rod protein FlgC
MDTIAGNVANIDVTRNADGQKIPYRRRFVVFAPGQTNDQVSAPGVHVQAIEQDQSPFRKIYDPGHADADKDGYVSYPNINPMEEMVNMLSATRSYEANLQAVNTTKEMALRTLDIVR